jgi:hypothetical protein
MVTLFQQVWLLQYSGEGATIAAISMAKHGPATRERTEEK